MNSLYHPVSIGSLNLDGNIFLAPMADFSDASYRSICADCGMDFGYTELISSEALVRDNKKTFEMMRRAPNEKAYAVRPEFIYSGGIEKGNKKDNPKAIPLEMYLFQYFLFLLFLLNMIDIIS